MATRKTTDHFARSANPPLGSKTCRSNVVHLLLLRAFVEQLLEGDLAGGLVDGGLEPLPGAAEFRGAVRVGQRRGVEDFPVNGAQDVAQRDVRRRAGEQVAAI